MMTRPDHILVIRPPLAWIVVMLAAFVSLAPPRVVHAQQPREINVHVNVPQSVYVGDPFDLQILVSGTENVEQPAVPEAPEYEIAYRLGMPRSSSTTIIINGRMSRQESFGYAHVFRLTARKPGTIVIPPFPVICDGRTFDTREIRINVLEPSQSGEFKLELVPEKTKIYAGEPIRLSMTWLLGKPIKDYAISFPALPAHAELLPAPDPRGAPGSNRRDPRFVEIPLGDETAVATVSQRELDGKKVDAVTIDRILIVREPGTLHVGSARADFNAVIGQRPRRLIDSMFDDLSIVERQSSVTTPFDIEVLPLPTAGRPADFSGLVGAYSITASAEPTEVSVGEPINLRITVSGPPPHSLIPLIDLNTQPAIASQFRVPRDPSLPLFTPLGAMFTYPIRARSAEQTQIPPIELSYFDTTKGAYQTARSAPIRIKVRPSTGVDFEFEEEPEVAAASAKPSSRVDTTPLSFTAASFDFSSAMRSPAAIAALTVPPAAFASLWLGAAVRRHAKADPARRRRRRAVKVARRKLGHVPAVADIQTEAGAVSHTLTDLAADWFDRPVGSLTSREAVELLGASDSQLTGPLATLLADCDRVRFAEDASESGDVRLADRARTVLGGVARALEGRP